jgi:hypothetical protein
VVVDAAADDMRRTGRPESVFPLGPLAPVVVGLTSSSPFVGAAPDLPEISVAVEFFDPRAADDPSDRDTDCQTGDGAVEPA